MPDRPLPSEDSSVSTSHLAVQALEIYMHATYYSQSYVSSWDLNSGLRLMQQVLLLTDLPLKWYLMQF